MVQNRMLFVTFEEKIFSERQHDIVSRLQTGVSA